MARSPARLLAPLALVACAIAILVIVNGNSSSSGGGASAPTTTATGSSTTTTTSQTGKKAKRTYRVKQGDVLSQIAVQTGVPLDEIQRLNPTIDAQSLHAGQKIKLAP
jgi:LysM repeat protein